MKIRKVYKYGTGQPIPDGAIYLSTVTQTEIHIDGHYPSNSAADNERWEKCRLVWHYFLVEVDDKDA